MSHSCTQFLRVLLLSVGVILLAISTGGPLGYAQSISRVEQTETNVNSFYYYVQPGAATVRAHVMGTVRYPGLYVVAEGTQLGELLSLAGGAVLDEREGISRRTVTIRLLRDTGRGRSAVYATTSAKGHLDTTAPVPVLQDGDVLEVEVVTRRGFSLRTALTVVNTVALVALAIERFATL